MTGEEAHWAGLGPEDAEMDLTAGSFKGEKRGLPIAHRDERSQEVETLRAQLAEAQERIRQLTNAVCNQRGDDLCWIASADEAKALPENEFLESCRRYRAQLASERGEFTEGLTIAELETKVCTLQAALEKNEKCPVCGGGKCNKCRYDSLSEI